MRTVLTALTIWILLLPGGCSHSASVERPEVRNLESETPQPKGIGEEVVPVVLTNSRTTASLPVAHEVLENAPAILEVSVTKVGNPTETPVAIFVYLTRVRRKGQAEPDKILVGNFSLYPPDRPGDFSLRASKAFNELRAKDRASKLNEIRLMFELKRINETQPWTTVEVTISSAKWLQQEVKVR